MVAKRPWTPEEMSKMVELKNSKIAVPKIAAEIGRSPAAIYVRLSQMQRAKRVPILRGFSKESTERFRQWLTDGIRHSFAELSLAHDGSVSVNIIYPAN